jgi:hypothetical protein
VVGRLLPVIKFYMELKQVYEAQMVSGVGKAGNAEKNVGREGYSKILRRYEKRKTVRVDQM